MSLRCAAAICSICLLTSTAAAQPVQKAVALSHEVLWSFQRVGAPVPSPDGKWVVFSVSEPSYDPQKDVTDLWIVAADGGSPARRLTSSKGSESGPAWSPDGTRIAFAAKRDDDEVNQIWPDENHWILRGENSRVFYGEVRSWLETYLIPLTPPAVTAGR